MIAAINLSISACAQIDTDGITSIKINPNLSISACAQIDTIAYVRVSTVEQNLSISACAQIDTAKMRKF